MRTLLPPRDDLRFSNTTGILQKKICGLLVLKYSKRRVHPLLKKILDPPLYLDGIKHSGSIVRAALPIPSLSREYNRNLCFIASRFIVL